MDSLTQTQKDAIAQWDEMGYTTPGNPILEFAYELFIKPFGLKCDALIYDALEAIEDEDLIPGFSEPRFDPELIDQNWQHYDTVAPLIKYKDWIEPIFSPAGYIEGFAYKQEPTADDPQLELQNFLENSTAGILELNAELVQAAQLYIDAALALLIAQEPEAESFAKAFLENRRRYPEAVFEIFTQQTEDSETQDPKDTSPPPSGNQ